MAVHVLYDHVIDGAASGMNTIIDDDHVVSSDYGIFSDGFHCAQCASAREQNRLNAAAPENQVHGTVSVWTVGMLDKNQILRLGRQSVKKVIAGRAFPIARPIINVDVFRLLSPAPSRRPFA